MKKSTNTYQVAIIEDHTLMREGLKLLIDRMNDCNVVWMAGNAGEAMRMLRTTPPDIMLVDITLPDRSGLELIKDVQAVRPNTKILVVTMHDEKLYVTRALRAGARGYITKDATHEEYQNAIRRVAAGHLCVSQAVSEEIMLNYALGEKSAKAKSGIESLSDRELEVFLLLGEGKSTPEVAQALRISPKTVDVHKMNMRSKLAVEDGAAITRLAIQWTESRRHGGSKAG